MKMQRLVITAMLLAGCLLPHGSFAAEEPTLLNERGLRSYDDMLNARLIRALVVRNKTGYFFDGAQQRGVHYDLLKTFEKQINDELETGHLLVHVAFISVTRDQLIPALLEGRGDVAVANLTITPEREELVDFSIPMLKNVRELVITGSGVPQMSSIDELSGKQIHVRDSSSYYASLVKANATLRDRGLAPIEIVLANEHLEDEDLLEMVNGGLVPAIVVDSHKAHFWQQIFDNIQVHEELALRHGGNIAWAFRKNSPEFEQALNKFLKKNRKGSLLGNILFKRYLQNTSFVRNSLAPEEIAKFNATIELFRQYAG